MKLRLYIHSWGNEEKVETIRVGQNETNKTGELPDTREEYNFKIKQETRED